MKTVVVIDTVWLGHVPTYHKILVSRFLALGHRVISVSPEKEKMAEWAKELPEASRQNLLIGEVSIDKSPPSTAQWMRWLGRFFKMKHFIRALDWWYARRHDVEVHSEISGWPVDLVFLPSVETNIITTALTGACLDKIFDYRWAGIYITPKYLRKNIIKFWHKRLLRKDRFFEARYCIAAAVLDEGVSSRLSQIIGQDKAVVMPDFTDGRLGSRLRTATPFEKAGGADAENLISRIEALSAGRKIIGLFGELSRRKGITTLINTARLAQQNKKDWFFIFVGALNEKNNSASELELLRKEISMAPANCFFSLTRVEDERQFNDIFTLCDAIFAAYEKFYHSSNILTKAAMFAKPVVVSKGFCMAERVHKYEMGVAITEKDPEATLRAIEALLKGQNLDGQNLKLDFVGYHRQHSLDRLDSFLETTLDKRPEIVSKSARRSLIKSYWMRSKAERRV